MKKIRIVLIVIMMTFLLFSYGTKSNAEEIDEEVGPISIEKKDNGIFLFHDRNESIEQNYYSKEDYERISYPMLSEEWEIYFQNEHHEEIPNAYYRDDETELSEEEIRQIEHEAKNYRVFDIKRYVNSKLVSTSFADGGYYTVLKVNNNQSQIVSNLRNVDGVSCDISGEFVNNGNYVKVTYAVKNNNTSACKFSLGTFSDIQIGTADDAEVIKQPDGSGIIMTDTSTNLQFKFFGRNVEGATNIDTLWIGAYPYQAAAVFNTNNLDSFKQFDSAFAYSWQNRTIAAGETQLYSVLFGVDELSAIPVVTLNKGLERYTSENAEVSGQVTDLNDNDKGKIYFNIDDGNQIYLGRYELTNNKSNFDIDLSKLALTDGVYKVKVWAIDESGLISTVTEKDVVIGASTPIPKPVENIVHNTPIVNNQVINNEVPKAENKVTNSGVDNTVASKTLPYTGFMDRIGVSLLVVSILARIFYKKYKKLDF